MILADLVKTVEKLAQKDILDNLLLIISIILSIVAIVLSIVTSIKLNKNSDRTSGVKSMTFKYQLHEGTVSFSLWLKLQFHVMSLIFIRFLRLCKRILIYSKRYIPLLLIIIGIELIIIPLGIQLNKYASWFEGLWDLRELFLTTLLVPLGIGIFQEESNRHKSLCKQYYAYETFKFESEQFMKRLFLMVETKYDDEIFFNEEQFDKFSNYIQLRIDTCAKGKNRKLEKLPVIHDLYFLHSTPIIKPKTYIQIICDSYLRYVDNLDQDIRNNTFIGQMYEALERLDEIREEIQKELIQIDTDSQSYTETQLLKFIEHIGAHILFAIANIRRPWRWDVERNNKIKDLLNN